MCFRNRSHVRKTSSAIKQPKCFGDVGQKPDDIMFWNVNGSDDFWQPQHKFSNETNSNLPKHELPNLKKAS